MKRARGALDHLFDPVMQSAVYRQRQLPEHYLKPHSPDEHPIFFFNDAPPTELYTLSLHDALPISKSCPHLTETSERAAGARPPRERGGRPRDRKSTRLNSSHSSISYAVFCLK